jgi:hypothetical protein
MRFVRHSKEPLTVVNPVTQIVDANSCGVSDCGSKPCGLWFSALRDDGTDPWIEYCKMRGGFDIGQYRTEIILNGDRMLYLRSAADIDRLTEQHGFRPLFRPDYTRFAIRWEIVAREFAGIVIAPECIERRTVDLWYYTWDVASGCVWNPSGVKGLKSFSPA